MTLPRSGGLAWDLVLDIEARAGPLHARLAAALRSAIESGQAPPGALLPSSRELAQELDCSRWVVTEAYAQLAAEGFLEARQGSGTRVRPHTGDSAAGRVGGAPPRRVRLDLVPGLPDLRAFPRARWQAAYREVMAVVPFPDLGYSDRWGQAELRDVLAAYLSRTRGVRLDGAAMVVTAGVTDAMVWVCRAMSRHGRFTVAVEDPGWTRLRAMLVHAGAAVVPVPVDAEGLRVDVLSEADVDAVLVTPSHQFPSGVRLSPGRRASLMAWARATDRLVFEDDYDAEFRHDRPHGPAMQPRDPGRVTLLGSVSKTLSPALGLGWMVVPTTFQPLLEDVPHISPPVLDQLALAHLIRGGAYDRHLRTVRRRYRHRRERLVSALAHHLPTCRVTGHAAGLHLVVQLPPGVRSTDVVEASRDLDMRVAAMTDYRVEPGRDDALVVGYANLDDHVVEQAGEALAQVVRDLGP